LQFAIDSGLSHDSRLTIHEAGSANHYHANWRMGRSQHTI
jgi:hypothetical protein